VSEAPVADRTAAAVARHHWSRSVSAQPSLGVLTWYPAAPWPSTVPSAAASSALTWLVPRSIPSTAGGPGGMLSMDRVYRTTSSIIGPGREAPPGGSAVRAR